MQTDEVRLCYSWGFIGWALVCAAATSGKMAWTLLAWLATRTDELYFWMACVTGATSFSVQYVVSTVMYLDRDAAAPTCTTNLRSAPDLAVWLLFHYWTVAFVHEQFVGVPWSWWRAAQRVLFAAAVPVILVASENSRWQYCLVGAAFGVAFGLLSAALLVFLWYPRMADVAQYTRWAGAMHWPDLRAAHHVLGDGRSPARVFY